LKRKRAKNSDSERDESERENKEFKRRVRKRERQTAESGYTLFVFTSGSFHFVLEGPGE